MVLVHGFSTPSFVWGGLIDNFTESGYKVLVYDHFGRGYSERPRIKYDKNLLVKDIVDMMSEKTFHWIQSKSDLELIVDQDSFKEEFLVKFLIWVENIMFRVHANPFERISNAFWTD